MEHDLYYETQKESKILITDRTNNIILSEPIKRQVLIEIETLRIDDEISRSELLAPRFGHSLIRSIDDQINHIVLVASSHLGIVHVTVDHVIESITSVDRFIMASINVIRRREVETKMTRIAARRFILPIAYCSTTTNAATAANCRRCPHWSWIAPANIYYCCY